MCGKMAQGLEEQAFQEMTIKYQGLLGCSFREPRQPPTTHPKKRSLFLINQDLGGAAALVKSQDRTSRSDAQSTHRVRISDLDLCVAFLAKIKIALYVDSLILIVMA